jgi:predicted amidohydrolase YtcJ
MKGWLVAGACVVVVGAVAAGVAAGTGGSDAERASDAPDTIVYNGRIATLDERGSNVEALAIRDGVIVASGSNGSVRGMAEDGTREIDLEGRRVLPGLIDGHLDGVRMGSEACFSRSPRFDAIFKRTDALKDVADRAQRTPAGRWLFQLDPGWGVTQFDAPGMLTLAELDAIAPSHPVYLQAAGFEGGQLNTRAMRTLRLTARSPGVEPDANGRPSGQVTGAADRRARRAIEAELAKLSADERESCTRHLVRELNRRGLTAWDDAGADDLQVVNRLHRAGELNARIRVNFDDVSPDQVGGIGDETLRIGGVGSAVLAPGARGVYPPREYRRILNELAAGEWAFEHRGARATTQQGMLADWERVNARRPITDLRWRILAPGGGPGEPNVDALARLKDLNAGVVPTDGNVVGASSEHPPYRRIYESGTRACLGTDGPYAPFVNLWYVVSGKTYDQHRGGVVADQRLDRRQALELATRRCDWFMGLDGRVGALEVGRFADLIVLSGDYFEVPVDQIRTLTSVMTMVGGRVVYGEGAFAELDSTASTIAR